MPRFSDIMIYKENTTLAETKEFDTQTQAMDIPNEFFAGFYFANFFGDRSRASRDQLSRTSPVPFLDLPETSEPP